jgi:hypothetical protein
LKDLGGVQRGWLEEGGHYALLFCAFGVGLGDWSGFTKRLAMIESRGAEVRNRWDERYSMLVVM